MLDNCIGGNDIIGDRIGEESGFTIGTSGEVIYPIFSGFRGWSRTVGAVWIPVILLIGEIGVSTGVVDRSGIGGNLPMGLLGATFIGLTVPTGIAVRGDVK